MESSFKEDINKFLMQPHIAKAQFIAFKLKYSLKYNDKDKKLLLKTFKIIDTHFKNGYYSGPSKLSEILNPKKKKKDTNKPNPIATKKKKNKRIKPPKPKKTTSKVSVKTKEDVINKIKDLKHKRKHYRFTKYKRLFLNKDLKIDDIADYYHYNQNRFLREMMNGFPSIKGSHKIHEHHIRYIINNLLDKLEKNKADKETIVTKNPKTKPNYFKVIYTR